MRQIEPVVRHLTEGPMAVPAERTARRLEGSFDAGAVPVLQTCSVPADPFRRRRVSATRVRGLRSGISPSGADVARGHISYKGRR